MNYQEKTTIIIWMIAMCTGQVYGIYSAFKHWNNKEKDGADIFYMLTTYSIVAPIALFALIPLSFVFLPIYLIDTIRKRN
jgi:hypothetical protein